MYNTSYTVDVLGPGSGVGDVASQLGSVTQDRRLRRGTGTVGASSRTVQNHSGPSLPRGPNVIPGRLTHRGVVSRYKTSFTHHSYSIKSQVAPRVTESSFPIQRRLYLSSSTRKKRPKKNLVSHTRVHPLRKGFTTQR